MQLYAKGLKTPEFIQDEDFCTIIWRKNASDLYRSLEREETKLWHLGAVALYSMWISA